jgi:hypothetical protein
MITKLRDRAIPPGRHRLKVGIRVAVGYRKTINTVEAHKCMAIDAQPQFQFIVVEEWQYAALAKCVNGANASIWAELSVVIA